MVFLTKSERDSYYLPTLLRYDHKNFYFFNKKHPIENFFPDYQTIMNKKINNYLKKKKKKKKNNIKFIKN